MEITPQLLEQIEFAEKFRGYDQDQVDDFLERVGAAIAQMTDDLREAESRAAAAETEAARLRKQLDSRPSTPAQAPPARAEETDVEQASRTLLLAQRTADAAIAEAKQEAEQLLSKAQREATQLTAKAQEESEHVTTQARSAAHKLWSEATTESAALLQEAKAKRDEAIRKARDTAEKELSGQRQAIRDDMNRAREQRDRLREEAALLDDHLVRQRNQIEEALEALQGVVSGPLSSMAPPARTPDLEQVPERTSLAAALDDEDFEPPQRSAPTAQPSPTTLASLHNATPPPAAPAAPARPAPAPTPAPVAATPAVRPAPTPVEPTAAPTPEAAPASKAAPSALPLSADVDEDDEDDLEPLADAAPPRSGARPGFFGPAPRGDDDTDDVDDADFEDQFDDGPPTEAIAAVAPIRGSEDKYLRELSDAVHGDADEDDERLAAFFSQADDDDRNWRFGRKR